MVSRYDINDGSYGEIFNLCHYYRGILYMGMENQVKDMERETGASRPQRNYVGRRVMTQEENQQLTVLVGQMSGFVKIMMGVADNCALLVMRYAHDKISDLRDSESYKERPRRPHPNYRHKAKMLFRKALEESVTWRTRLLNPSRDEVRFFHVDDIQPDARKKYGEMTDQEYFEFWQATGSRAYTECFPLVTSLWDKFRLSMQAHGIGHADQTAWGLTALTVLQLSVDSWNSTLLSVNDAMERRLSPAFMERIYRPFLLSRVADLWEQALIALSPETADYKLDSREERNIELGIRQLREKWISPTTPFDSLSGAVEDYDDIFRTKGEMKKAMREIGELRDIAVRNAERSRREELQHAAGGK